MKRFLPIIILLAFVAMLNGQGREYASTCRKCGATTYRNADGSWPPRNHRHGCPYARTTGGTANMGEDQSMLGSILKSIFAEPDTSKLKETERLNAIKLQQEKEQKEAARKSSNQAWIDLQAIEQEKRTFDDSKKREVGEAFLGNIETANSGVLPFKTLESGPPQGSAGEPLSELSDEFMAVQGKLIQQRLEEPNKWCSAIYKTLKTNAPPPPRKKLDELQPGDVLLLEGKAVAFIDNLFSSGPEASRASHTVIFLKDIGGKKYFLDNQPALVNGGKGGSRIIDEEEYREKYGQRGTEVARLVGQPLKPEEAKLLFAAAVEKAQQNRQAIAKNWFGSPWLGTRYGVWGKDDVVCSEVDWALINATGRSIPESDNWAKAKLLKFSPADYVNSQFFVVTRFD